MYLKKVFDETEAIVNDNSNSTQEKVDAVKKVLEDAYNALEKADKTVDKSKLEEAYNKYKDLKNDGYTKDSWKVFENALNKAKTVLDDKNATEEQVNNALAQLENAVKKLEKAPNGGNAGSGSNGGVKTGDSSNMMLWGILAAAELVSGVIAKKKKY